VAGVVAVAVELQAGLRVPLPPSIQVLVADVAEIVAVRREVSLQHCHFAIRRIFVALYNGVR
jgi:hypothetical protein